MKRTWTPRRQHLPLAVLALVYLLAAAPLIWPTAQPPARFAPPISPPPAAAPAAAQPAAQAAFTALQARSAAPIDVAYHPLTGVAEWVLPRHADGRLPYTPTSVEAGNPEATARGFLDQNRELFGLRS